MQTKTTFNGEEVKTMSKKILGLGFVAIVGFSGCGKNSEQQIATGEAKDLTLMSRPAGTDKSSLDSYPAYCGWVDSVLELRDNSQIEFTVSAPMRDRARLFENRKQDRKAAAIIIAGFQNDSLLCFCYNTNSGYGEPFGNSYLYSFRLERLKRTATLEEFNKQLENQMSNCSPEDRNRKTISEKFGNK